MIEVDLDEFDALCRINTRATLIVNREAARQVRSGGAIVNLSSSAVGSASPRHGAYAASKAATDVLTRVLALELRHRDITVNAVSLEVDKPLRARQDRRHRRAPAQRRRPSLTGQMIRLDETFPGTT